MEFVGEGGGVESAVINGVLNSAAFVMGSAAHLADELGFRAPRALPPVTGRAQEPTLAEMVQDLIDGAKVPVGSPNHSPQFPDPFGAALGWLAAGAATAGQNVWGWLNRPALPPTAGPYPGAPAGTVVNLTLSPRQVAYSVEMKADTCSWFGGWNCGPETITRWEAASPQWPIIATGLDLGLSDQGTDSYGRRVQFCLPRLSGFTSSGQPAWMQINQRVIRYGSLQLTIRPIETNENGWSSTTNLVPPAPRDTRLPTFPRIAPPEIPFRTQPPQTERTRTTPPAARGLPAGPLRETAAAVQGLGPAAASTAAQWRPAWPVAGLGAGVLQPQVFTLRWAGGPFMPRQVLPGSGAAGAVAALQAIGTRSQTGSGVAAPALAATSTAGPTIGSQQLDGTRTSTATSSDPATTAGNGTALQPNGTMARPSGAPQAITVPTLAPGIRPQTMGQATATTTGATGGGIGALQTIAAGLQTVSGPTAAPAAPVNSGEPTTANRPAGPSNPADVVSSMVAILGLQSLAASGQIPAAAALGALFNPGPAGPAGPPGPMGPAGASAAGTTATVAPAAVLGAQLSGADGAMAQLGALQTVGALQTAGPLLPVLRPEGLQQPATAIAGQTLPPWLWPGVQTGQIDPSAKPSTTPAAAVPGTAAPFPSVPVPAIVPIRSVPLTDPGTLPATQPQTAPITAPTAHAIGAIPATGGAPVTVEAPSPRADLLSIAQELARVEAKLALMMQPRDTRPDVGDFISNLANMYVLLEEIRAAMTVDAAGRTWTVTAPCDTGTDGAPVSTTWTLPPADFGPATLARLDALMDAFSQSIGWRRKVCRGGSSSGASPYNNVTITAYSVQDNP